MSLRNGPIVDLNEIAKHYDASFASKKSEDPEDAKLRRFKDKWLFISTLIAIGMMFILCFYIIIFRQNSSNVALNAIFGLTSALIGYYARGKTHG